MIFAVGVWPAHAGVSGVSVADPDHGQVIDGSYSSDGTASGFNFVIRGFATTSCTQGWQSASFLVKSVDPAGYQKTFTLSPPGNEGTWQASATWATQDLKNGVYTVQFNVREKEALLGNCSGQSGQDTNTAKLANPPKAPVFESLSSSDDPPRATIKWKKNPEDDIVSYHIIRSGPDGTKTAIVGSTGCGGVYSCDDTSFPADYSGTYTYKIVAYRAAPAGTGEDCGSGRCVKSNASDTRSVTLTKPTPTPTPSPTDSPTGSPSSTPSPGGGGGGQNQVGGGSTTGPNARPGGSSVLSFGNGGGGGGGAGFNEFYSGTYDENLPYEPKTLVIGGGKTTPNGRQVEAASLSDEPPNYRTIMLPVAGGLLAFLSAAHVRRLLIHF